MYTSPSPLPRRAPLRLPFSVHIRTLFFLFLSLFSGAPRRTHLVGAGVCPSVCPAVAPFSHPVGAGVLDGPHRFSSTLPAGLFRTPTDTPRRGRRPRRPAHVSSMSPTGRVPRSGATPFCPRRQKGAKTPPKTNGFWISLFRLQLHHKKVPQRIACTSIPAAAPTCRRIVPHPTAAEQCCGRFSTLRCTMILNFPRPSGPHIHLPPAAASARFDNRSNR